MNLPEFLTQADGEVRMTGHRVGLYHVVSLYDDGYSVEKIAAHFPTLPLALIHKVIAFYLENEAEVSAYVAAYQGELDRQEGDARAAGGTPTLAQLRERLARMRSAGQA